ncbi:coiled-coil domain-containing protein 157 isoform X1 [Lethenteron reissneri]|uniref:coiled-coil domain-containing protein 157 isoform X1 n=2 Tax=Lethenteron reissneri TaxID=7753 RepID=UPI002AB7C8F3|nr:coiled-coil domain-containing protein 157 isoform X1 [Lethenteron reissneri]
MRGATALNQRSPKAPLGLVLHPVSGVYTQQYTSHGGLAGPAPHSDIPSHYTSTRKKVPPTAMTDMDSTELRCVTLRRDLTELQGLLISVASRTGVHACPSWRYPDRPAWHLDLPVLLQQELEEQNQDGTREVTLLLELIVDRLVLLLLTVERFVSGASEWWRGGVAPPDRDVKGSSVSVSLAARWLWERLITSYGRQEAPEQDLQKGIKKDMGAQDATTQTGSWTGSFCSRCMSTQTGMRVVCDAVMKLCQSQQLPSCLSQLRSNVGQGPGHPTDTSRWAANMARDLTRVMRHMERLEGEVVPLKAELEQEKQQAADIAASLRNAKAELNFTVGRLQRDHERTVQAMDKERLEVIREKAKCEEVIQQHQETVRCHMSTVSNLELKLRASEAQSRARIQEMEKALEGEILRAREAKKDLEGAWERVRDTKAQAASQTALANNLQKHVQAVLGKQASLCDRVAQLDAECEQLREDLGMSEEKRVGLISEAAFSAKSCANLREQLHSAIELARQEEKRRKEAEEAIMDRERALSALQEQQHLLICHPELHTPTELIPEYSGDVLGDMERHIQANTTRVRILQSENSRLSAAIHKLRQRLPKPTGRVGGT